MRMVKLSVGGGVIYVNRELIQAVVPDTELTCVVVLPDSEYMIDMPAEDVVTLLSW